MNIILSHNNLDFDGLGAMLGVRKIMPQAQIVLAGKVSKNVQEFLSLYKDAFSYKFAHQLEKGQIESAILVDIADAMRLGPLKDFLVKHPQKVVAVYDHHPKGEADFPVGKGIIEEIGATTTLLVEEIKAQEIELNPFEATVLALGIYEDTGSLTFSTTTARDVYAVGYLLEKGAKLSTVASFIDRPITVEQQSLLNKLLSGQQLYHIHGYKVLLAVATTDNFVAGLDIVTHKLAEISNADILFSLVLMADRMHLVARNRVDAADVGEIVGEFGGGGHSKAASAVIRSQELEKVTTKLLSILPQRIRPAVTAAKIMSSPVKTLSPDISIQEAGKIMLRYGHSGLPVVKDGKLVGIISRRDLDKARHHGLGHAPVKAFMSRNVLTVYPETSLAEIQTVMMEKDVGRMPVIKNSNLVGIVSRTDVLQTLHGESLPTSFSTNFLQSIPMDTTNNLAELLSERLPENIYQLIVGIGKLADKHGFNVYLVGGFVRDLLLNLPNFDLDIVVEGDGLTFARLLAEKLGAKVRAHEKFATAVILLSNGEKIDVATARTEFYEYPAALPTVESSSLRQDLYRRDFTINAMALNINAMNFGEFIDYFNGKSDLDQKLVRVLYNLSFIEDPTRIIRAIRFEQRYGFLIEEQTMTFAINAMESNLIEELSFHRIREELDLILHEINPLPALRRVKEIGLWNHIMPEVVLDAKVWSALECTRSYLQKSQIQYKLNNALLYLCTLFAYINEQKAVVILERFQWTKKEREVVLEFINLRQAVLEIISGKEMTMADWHLSFMDNCPEALLAASCFLSLEKRKILQSYCEKRLSVNLAISGKDIIGLGVTPGPLYKTLLAQVFAAKISGVVRGKKSELAYIKKLLEEVDEKTKKIKEMEN